MKGCIEIQRELTNRVDMRVLRWFGHIVRMDEYRMARRIFMAASESLGKQRLDLMNCVKVTLGSGGMTVKAAWKIEKIREPWCMC